MITSKRFIELWKDPETAALARRITDIIDYSNVDVDRAYVAMIAVSGCAILAAAERHGNVGILIRAFLAGVQERAGDVAAAEMVAGRMP